MPPSADAVRSLAARQDGVVTTAQLAQLGAVRSWVARQVSSGRWQRLYPGVLVVHSGPVLWRTRARAALLHAEEGAALSHRSAAQVHGFAVTPPAGLIEVSVPHGRRLAAVPGLRVHRRRSMPLAYGRLRAVAPAPTLVDLLPATEDTDAVVALLCAAVRAGVHPDRVLRELASRGRVRRRDLVTELLAAVSQGVESPLELRYHRDVERRHALPASELQVRHVLQGRWVRADAVYPGLGVRVELDGELAHPGGRTDADTWRDNAVLLSRSETTLRYRWRHVAGAPCATAGQVACALRAGGWPRHPRACSPGCPVHAQWGGPVA